MPEEKVIAAVRCRPLISKEINEGCQTCLEFVPNEPQVVLGKDRAFTFDFVFNPRDPQSVVYEASVKHLVDGIFKGYNATVLAYGQTGSGKTFTMGGCYEGSLSGNEEDMGVIPRALRDIFSGIAERPESKFDVRVSYLEIYNEDILDLFCPPSQRDNLAIREEASGEIKIPGLQELAVVSCEETLERLARGSQGRTTGATAMNATSSRSHAIFTIYIQQQKKDDPADCWKAKFHLVDLAGSERVKRTQAEGERLKEGININKGLLYLGYVISALGDEMQRKGHIPYRNSKLTRLLQDSLGGNSQTLMIACVSPVDSNLEETLNTLRYADRARNIKNKPIINRDPQTAEIMRLKSLVQELQSQLTQGGNALCTVTGSVSTSSQDNARNKQLEEENMKLTQELERAVDQNTRMCERAIELELSRDRLQQRLQSFKQQTGVNFDLLSSSIDTENNPQLKAELEKQQKLAQQFCSCSESESTGDEPEIQEIDLENAEEHDSGGEAALPTTPDMRAFSTQHALRQAHLGRELQELNHLLAKKEELANQMTQNKMEVMRMQYEIATKELKRDIAKLQEEWDELTNAFQEAKTHSAANKISERRPRRLQELEIQLSGMKKKLDDQTKEVLQLLQKASVKKIFVGGIKKDTTEDQIRSVFSQFGTLESVEMIKEKGTDKVRGFCFVTFDDYDAVDKAVLIKRHDVNGRTVEVKKFLSRSEMNKGGSMRGGRGPMMGRAMGGGGRFGSGGYSGGYGNQGGGYGGGYNSGGSGWNQGGSGAGGYDSFGGGYNQGDGNWNNQISFGSGYGDSYGGGAIKGGGYSQRGQGPYGSGYGNGRWWLRPWLWLWLPHPTPTPHPFSQVVRVR